MTEPDRDPAAPAPPPNRPRVRVRAPILDLEASRVKDETPPAPPPQEPPAEEPPGAAAEAGLSASAAPETAPGSQPGVPVEPAATEPGPRPSSLPPGRILAADELAARAAPGDDRTARETPAGPEAPVAPAAGAGEPPARTRKGVGFGGLLAASLLGGVIGAGLGLAGDRVWRARSGDPVEGRLTRLEQRAGGDPSADATAGIERRLGSLEGALKEASERARAAEAAAAAASARAGEALARPVSAASEAAPPGPDPRLDELAKRLEAVEARLAERTSAEQGAAGATDRRDAERDERLAALERKLQESAAADATRGEALQKRLVQQERRFEEQDRRLAAQSQEAQQRLAAAAQAIEARLADVTKLATAGREEPVARASGRLALAEGIARALRDGEPYAPALTALRRVGVDDKTAAALAPFAESGAPKPADLAREFRALADRVRAERRAAVAEAAPASWEDRLRSMADALVKVRPVQSEDAARAPGEAADPFAATAGALDRGDLAGAARAWDALPEPARQAGPAFGTRLKQRAEAAEAARSLTREALAAFQSATAQ